MAEDRCDLLCLDLPHAEAIRNELPSVEALGAVAQRAQSVADPTRLRLALALAESDELCGCDLAWILGRAQNLVSHHLRVLRDCGVVSSRRDGKMVMHSLTEEGHALLALLGEQVPA
jgi:ArsR family transcriptional regulator, lead/cadmium/zinc/bismuth-responsive transcriptional repressor